MSRPFTWQVAAPSFDIRQLAPEELLQLGQRPIGRRTPSLQKLRTVHHQAARLVAVGLRNVEICTITGLSQSRLSILKNDPAFCELIEHYAQMEEQRQEDLAEKIKMVGTTALEILLERLDESPEDIPINQLMEIAANCFDRSGHGVQSKVDKRVLSATLDSETLAEIKTLVHKGDTRVPENLRPALGRIIEQRALEKVPEEIHADTKTGTSV